MAVLMPGLIQPLAAEERSNRADWHGRQDAGATACRRGDYDQAEAELKRACEIAEKFQQPDARLILSLNELAAVHTQQARYDEAEPLLQRAVQVTRQLRGPNHLETADMSIQLGKAVPATRQVESSRSRLPTSSFDRRERSGNPAHPDFAVCLNNLASLYRQQENLDKAALLYRQSLAILEVSLVLTTRKSAFV